MVDAAVTVPEPRPQDDEDVVWGLSTAAALWARGERGDAIVWLRRAAEAAAAAGQEGRAAELGGFAVGLEQAHEALAQASAPSAVSTAEGADPSEGDRLSGTYEEIDVEPVPPLPPPRRAGTIRPPPSPVHAVDAGVQAPQIPREPAPAVRAPSIAPPPAAPRVAPVTQAQPPKPAASPDPPKAPPPPAAAEPIHVEAPAAPAAAPQPVAQASARPPSIPPPPPAPRAPAPSSYPGARKTAGPRVPILDPWADEPALPSIRVDAALRAVQLEGDEVVVHMRRSAPRIVEEDDGVITSAAPLDHTLRRVSRPPTPPTRKWTATGEQPPGYIADASTAVAAKSGAKPRPPGPPPSGHGAGHPQIPGPPQAPTLPTPGHADPPGPAARGASPEKPPAAGAEAQPPVAPTPGHAEASQPPDAVESPRDLAGPAVPAASAPDRKPEAPKSTAQPATTDALRSAATVPSFMLAGAASAGTLSGGVRAPSSTGVSKPAPAKPTTPSVPPGPVDALRPASPTGNVPKPAPLAVPSPASSAGELSKPSPFEVPTQPTSASTIPRPRRASILPPPPAADPPRAATQRIPAAPVEPAKRPTPEPTKLSAPEAPRPSVRPPVPSVRPPPASSAAASIRVPPRPGVPSPKPAAPTAAARLPRIALDAGALERVEALADVPPDVRARLVSLARVEALSADDEVSSFGAALLISGSASVCATIVDEPIAHAEPDTVVPTKGTFAGAVALRVVAGPDGARIAVWDQVILDDALRACPWVLEELTARADRLQALAGATMGPLGELAEAVRDRVLSRLVVKVARPQDPVAAEPGVALVCVGSVEIRGGAGPAVVRAGEVLFPRADVAEARAGAHGALLLVGDAPPAAELLADPSLATLFAGR